MARKFGIGFLIQVLIPVVLLGLIPVGSRFLGAGFGVAAALSLLPVVLVVDTIFLLVILLMLVVLGRKGRLSEGLGLLLGWLAGVAVCVVLLMIVNVAS